MKKQIKIINKKSNLSDKVICPVSLSRKDCFHITKFPQLNLSTPTHKDCFHITEFSQAIKGMINKKSNISVVVNSPINHYQIKSKSTAKPSFGFHITKFPQLNLAGNC